MEWQLACRAAKSTPRASSIQISNDLPENAGKRSITPLIAEGRGLTLRTRWILVAGVLGAVLTVAAVGFYRASAPFSGSPTATNSFDAGPEASGNSSSFALERFKQLREFAYSSDGLDMTSPLATAWAEERLHEDPQFDVARFTAIYRFAYEADGLNLTRPEATASALNRLKEDRMFDAGRFRELFAYAYRSDGLNLTRQQAADWALKKMSNAK